jgi:hypothetical protein
MWQINKESVIEDGNGIGKPAEDEGWRLGKWPGRK